jgi:hypothetical protein
MEKQKVPTFFINALCQIFGLCRDYPYTIFLAYPCPKVPWGAAYNRAILPLSKLLLLAFIAFSPVVPAIFTFLVTAGNQQ